MLFHGKSARSILLVEDDSLVALKEKTGLEDLGHRVRLVRSGEEAVKAVGEEGASFDLVLMDIELGAGMDGIEATRAIAALRDLPVVFLSVHTERFLAERTESVTSYGFVAKDAGIQVLDASIEMALKLFRAHKAEMLKEAELVEVRKSLEAVIKGSGAGTWEWRMDSGELTVNGRYIEMLGYRRAELEPITDSTFRNLIHPDDLVRSDRITERYDSGEIGSHEILERLRHKDGHWVWVLDRGMVTERDASGKPVRMSGMHFDVSELKGIEAELEESRNQLSLAIEGSGIGLWDRDLRTGASTYNEHWARIAGYGLEELRAMDGDAWRSLAHPQDWEKAESLLVEYLAGYVPCYECEVRMRHKAGHWVWVLTRGKVVERASDGSPLRMIGTHLDITERKRTEEAQASLVAQKVTLMKELQHRVKNSLAVVSSLLGLEMSKAPEGGPREALAEAIGRIRSVALIYERLYLSEDLVSVDLALYVRDVATSTLETYGNGRDGPCLDLDLGAVTTDSKRAVPLGLILSELLVNALKYAYPGNGGGRIGVEVGALDGDILLAVEDDGVGFPRGFDPAAARSLGMSLVSMLAEQVGGKARFGSSAAGGARVEIRVPRA